MQVNLLEDAPATVAGARLPTRGLLRPVRPDAPENDFERYLVGSGVSHIFRRAYLDGSAAPAPPPNRAAARLREAFKQTLRRGSTPDDPRPGVLTAMLLGETAALEVEQRERYRRTGTLHLFAISGLHIGLIATMLAFVLKRLGCGLRVNGCVSLALLITYVWIVGAPPSAVRAVIMVGTFWLALMLWRQPGLFPALILSALIVLLIDPAQLFSPGFQLSYTIVAGLILYGIPIADAVIARLEADPLRPLPELTWHRRQVRRAIRFTVGVHAISWAALVSGGALIAAFFGIVTPGGILLSIPISIFAFVTLGAGLVSLAGSLIPNWDGLTLFANWVAYHLIGWMDTLLAHSTRTSGLFLEITPPPAYQAFLATGLILTTMYYFAQRRLTATLPGILFPPILLLCFLLIHLNR